ncbi:MAG: hypothetical protein J6A03_13720 [Lachnospiraceae bacterium]|nr:hypothetical protein [Lachnospiraceae bacterium]
MNKFQKLPWAKKSVKIAISIGQDADDDVLLEFTGNRELILQANNAKMLAKMIKWASTAISAVSSGVSNTGEDRIQDTMSVDKDANLYYDAIYLYSSLLLEYPESSHKFVLGKYYKKL